MNRKEETRQYPKIGYCLVSDDYKYTSQKIHLKTLQIPTFSQSGPITEKGTIPLQELRPLVE